MRCRRRLARGRADVLSRSNTSSAPKPNASSGPPKNAAEAVKLAYLTAEQEKARFERARAEADRMQSLAAQGITVAPVTSPSITSPSSGNKTSPPSNKTSLPLNKPTTPTKSSPSNTNKPAASSKNTPWPTAEEEKLRMFNEAQRAVQRTQGIVCCLIWLKNNPVKVIRMKALKPLNARRIFWKLPTVILIGAQMLALIIGVCYLEIAVLRFSSHRITSTSITTSRRGWLALDLYSMSQYLNFNQDAGDTTILRTALIQNSIFGLPERDTDVPPDTKTRAVTQEGVTLTVERNQTCYGPGDRITVNATVKSDESLHAVILCGFEISLRESMIFRAGPYAAGKKVILEVQEAIVAENQYSCVYGDREAFGDGTSGGAPSLSLTQSSATNPAMRADRTAATFNRHGRNNSFGAPSAANTISGGGISNAFGAGGVNGAPGHKTLGSKSSFDRLGEFGARDFTRSAGGSNSRPGSAGFTIKNAVREEVGEGSRSNTFQPKPTPSTGQQGIEGPVVLPYESLFAGAGYVEAQSTEVDLIQQIFYVFSSVPHNFPTKENLHQVPVVSPYEGAGSGGGSGGYGAASGGYGANAGGYGANAGGYGANAGGYGANAGGYGANAGGYGANNGGYGGGSGSGSGSASYTAQVANANVSRKKSAEAKGSAAPIPAYRSAEEEKEAQRKYYQAKNAVDRTMKGEVEEGVGGIAPVNGLSGPIAYDSLYPSSSAPAPSESPPPFNAPINPTDAQSALQEKVRLRRAYEAQDAAAARGGGGGGYNNNDGGGGGYNDRNDAPPPSFSASPPSQPPSFSNSTAAFPNLNSTAAFPNSTAAAFQPGVGLSADAGSAIAEKERLRRKYEMQDREAGANGPIRAAGANGPIPPGANGPIPPPRQSSVLLPPVSPNQGSGRPGNERQGSGNERQASGNERQASGNERQASLTGRARPTPPASAAGQKPMTAAEEKALLGAKFGVAPTSANGINGGGINGGTGTKVPTTPPPLMPRPPVSYIQETQEEDPRVSRMVAHAVVPMDDVKRDSTLDDFKRGSTLDGVAEEGYRGAEEVNGIKMAGPPPPLPPKPAE
ncbi:hypothetical protein C8J56DRAFT_896224 [Mycena floridula]|nr:hypothetical protein C8J56DRAFT_896224 [Mycena floridula]